MKHKYLIDNKIPHGIYKPKKGDHRIPDWREARKEYGFDERETWSLRSNFLGWLYERIKMYIDVCDCDLSYHIFKYDGKEYTQQQILDKICKDIELYYNVDECFFNETGKGIQEWWSEQPKFLREIGTLWGIVLPAMWW